MQESRSGDTIIAMVEARIRLSNLGKATEPVPQEREPQRGDTTVHALLRHAVAPHFFCDETVASSFRQIKCAEPPLPRLLLYRHAVANLDFFNTLERR